MVTEKKNSEETILGLPVEYCNNCKTKRIVSSDRTFCLTCGHYIKKEKGGNACK